MAWRHIVFRKKSRTQQSRVQQCSKCPGDKEYYCIPCDCDLCVECKDNHEKDIKAHNVIGYLEKIRCIPRQEFCSAHPKKVYMWYCIPCQVPACDSCKTHRKHQQIDILTAYRRKRHQLKRTVQIIRSETLFYISVFLSRMKNDVKFVHKEISIHQAEILEKAQRLKLLIDNVLCDVALKHGCLNQKIKANKEIMCMQKYEHMYEQSLNRPLQFFFSLKKCFPTITLTLHARQLFMKELLKKENIKDTLCSYQITERRRRLKGERSLLKLVSSPKFHKSLTVTGIDCCYHISCVKSGHAWVSGFRNKLILTNTTGETLENREKGLSDFYRNGLHTINGKGELIYISWNYNVNKISKDMKNITTQFQLHSSIWEPRCVCWSQSTRDILIGMATGEQLDGRNADLEDTGQVTRYSENGTFKQYIRYTETGIKLFSEPRWIIENHNGDIVVSDDDSAVVVTERCGRHRFSYTGNPSGLELVPQGICADMFSNILVCDWKTRTVQVIDMDGQFLLNLLMNNSEKLAPHSLSYDTNTNRLWVGSGSDNKVCIYRYIN